MKLINIILRILLIICIFIIVTLIIFSNTKVFYSEYVNACIEQCNDLGLIFYKIDFPSRIYETCFCLNEDNEPINTGALK